MKLKYVAAFTPGGTPSTDDPSNWDSESGDGVAWVAISDMSTTARVKSTRKLLTSKGVRSKGLAVGPVGTVLFAMYASVGAVSHLGIPATWNQAILGINAIRERADNRFIAYWLKSLAQDFGSITRTSTQDNLNADQVANLPFSTKPLHEQRRIADFLDDQVARIDNIVAAREKQQQLEEVALSATLRGLLLEGATVPARRLLREAVVGIVVQPSKYYVDAEEPGIPALRGLNVAENEISTENLVRISHEGHAMHPRSRLKAGDVVVVRTGDAGAASQVPGWADDWNAIDLVILRANEVTDSRYLMHALNANRRDQVIAASSSGSIQQHFGVGAVGDLPIVYRGLEEQALAAAAADSAYLRADQRKSQLRESIRLFQELKRSLITATVTGKFDVSTADGSRVLV